MRRANRVQRSTTEVRSPWTTAEAKLRDAGATDDEVATFAEAWSYIDQPSLLSASRSALRAVLDDMRAGGSLLTDDELAGAEPVIPEGDGLSVVAEGLAQVAGVPVADGGDPAGAVAEPVAPAPSEGAENLPDLGAVYDAEKVADMTVPETQKWVGLDAARAALVLEREVNGQRRKGIVEGCQSVIDAAARGAV